MLGAPASRSRLRARLRRNAVTRGRMTASRSSPPSCCGVRRRGRPDGNAALDAQHPPGGVGDDSPIAASGHRPAPPAGSARRYGQARMGPVTSQGAFTS